MGNPFKSDPANQGKKLAQQIIKQMAQEPVEIAKQALGQVSGLESNPNPSVQDNQEQNSQNSQNLQNEKLMEQKSIAQGQRQIQALENELKEITEKKKMEKKKEEIIKSQKEESEKESKPPLVIPSSKKTRNIFAVFGRKPKQGSALQAERQKTRVERIMPPTG